ncbi:MAG: flagellar regulator YcgR PilZN domain-containing protein [Gallionella sp.]
MEKDISLNFENLSEETDDKQRISSPNEIRFVMQYIAEKGNRVALYYGNENDFILTTIIAADEAGLWLEQSPHPSDNLRVANSDRLIFVSSHLQIKVQFIASRARSVQYRNQAAFFLPLPDSLYRLQRREYFRLMTPVIKPLRCIIDKKSTGDKPLEFIIMDISCGGVGLTCMESDTDLAPGVSYPECQIELPELGAIRGTIIVKNLVTLTTRSGIVQKRAGCEFRNLDGASSILLQRYVTNMQRKRT